MKLLVTQVRLGLLRELLTEFLCGMIEEHYGVLIGIGRECDRRRSRAGIYTEHREGRKRRIIDLDISQMNIRADFCKFYSFFFFLKSNIQD